MSEPRLVMGVPLRVDVLRGSVLRTGYTLYICSVFYYIIITPKQQAIYSYTLPLQFNDIFFIHHSNRETPSEATERFDLCFYAANRENRDSDKRKYCQIIPASIKISHTITSLPSVQVFYSVNFINSVNYRPADVQSLRLVSDSDKRIPTI